MAEIINLREARKRRQRRLDERQAAENRAGFGLGKAAKALLKRERERQRTRLEGHRREDPQRDGRTREEEDR